MSRDFPGRHWFLIALILLIPVGMLAPGFGIAIKQNGWTVPLFVGIMLGIAGFTMDTSQLVRQSVNLRAIVPVLFCTYTLPPDCRPLCILKLDASPSPRSITSSIGASSSVSWSNTFLKNAVPVS